LDLSLAHSISQQLKDATGKAVVDMYRTSKGLARYAFIGLGHAIIALSTRAIVANCPLLRRPAMPAPAAPYGPPAGYRAAPRQYPEYHEQACLLLRTRSVDSRSALCFVNAKRKQ
jgi:hypothetical protein